jgi:hypothetical protein
MRGPRRTNGNFSSKWGLYSITVLIKSLTDTFSKLCWEVSLLKKESIFFKAQPTNYHGNIRPGNLGHTSRSPLLWKSLLNVPRTLQLHVNPCSNILHCNGQECEQQQKICVNGLLKHAVANILATVDIASAGNVFDFAASVNVLTMILLPLLGRSGVARLLTPGKTQNLKCD